MKECEDQWKRPQTRAGTLGITVYSAIITVLMELSWWTETTTDIKVKTFHQTLGS